MINAPKSLSIAAALHPDVSEALDRAQADAVAKIRSWLARHSVTRVGPRGLQEVVGVGPARDGGIVHKTSRAGDPHRHVHFQIGTRVFADGKWRGLDTAALFKQQGAIRALGTAVIAAHPELARVLAAHGLSLNHVTGEVVELEQYNVVLVEAHLPGRAQSRRPGCCMGGRAPRRGARAGRARQDARPRLGSPTTAQEAGP